MHKNENYVYSWRCEACLKLAIGFCQESSQFTGLECATPLVEWGVCSGLQGAALPNKPGLAVVSCQVRQVWSGLVRSGQAGLVWSGQVWSDLVRQVWSGQSGLVWSGLICQAESVMSGSVIPSLSCRVWVSWTERLDTCSRTVELDGWLETGWTAGLVRGPGQMNCATSLDRTGLARTITVFTCIIGRQNWTTELDNIIWQQNWAT